MHLLVDKHPSNFCSRESSVFHTRETSTSSLSLDVEKINCYINQFITQPIGNRTLRGLFYISCGINYDMKAQSNIWVF